LVPITWFPVTANALIREEAGESRLHRGREKYLILGSSDVEEIVKDIVATKPDLIVNTINGIRTWPFFRACAGRGLPPDSSHAVDGLSEESWARVGPRATKGDYVAATYFQSLSVRRIATG